MRALGAVYGPYTGICFASSRETDIEHIIATSEAHASGPCAAEPSLKVEAVQRYRAASSTPVLESIRTSANLSRPTSENRSGLLPAGGV